MTGDLTADGLADQTPAFSGPSAGEQLRSARERAALTVEDVARTLHLDVAVVHHLEGNQFEDLGAAVFVKGHLRRYAALLRLSEADVITAWQARLPSIAEPGLVIRKPVMREQFNVGSWGLIAVLLVGAMALALYYFSGAEPVSAPEAVEIAAQDQIFEGLPEPTAVEAEYSWQ